MTKRKDKKEREIKKTSKPKISSQDIKFIKSEEIFTPQEIASFNNMMQPINSDPKKSKFYNTAELDKEGINYNNWFKLHYNISHHILSISSEAFQLLLCLVCHLHTRDKEILVTNLKMLMETLQIEDIKLIKKCLARLLQHKYIYIKENIDSIKVNDIITIVILFNNNLIAFESEGFRPIPVDYFNRCLLNLSPIKCAIVCILIDQFTYITKKSYTDSSGTQIYTYKECEYSFPNLDTIGAWTGYERKTVKKHIEELATKKILSYGINGDKPHNGWKDEQETIVNPNYIYRVKLLQRIEYQYYYIYLFDKFDKRDRKEISHIRNNMQEYLTSSNQSQVKQWDFAMNRYMYTDIDKAIKSNNNNFYNVFSKPTLLVIEDFKNENLEWTNEESEEDNNEVNYNDDKKKTS